MEAKTYGRIKCPFCDEGLAYTKYFSRYIEEGYMEGYHFRISRHYHCTNCQAQFVFDTIEKDLDINKVLERDRIWAEKLKVNN